MREIRVGKECVLLEIVVRIQGQPISSATTSISTSKIINFKSCVSEEESVYGEKDYTLNSRKALKRGSSTSSYLLY